MNAINEIINLQNQAPEKTYNHCVMRCSCRQQTSGGIRGLS